MVLGPCRFQGHSEKSGNVGGGYIHTYEEEDTFQGHSEKSGKVRP